MTYRSVSFSCLCESGSISARIDSNRIKSVNVMMPFLFQDIDEYICQAKDKSYDTLVHYGRKGLNVAATAAVMAATKVLLTRSVSLH